VSKRGALTDERLGDFDVATREPALEVRQALARPVVALARIDASAQRTSPFLEPTPESGSG
jgi:hypothetical protein